jgi:ABC-type proline/glycine betaine transport system ATPase subunit
MAGISYIDATCVYEGATTPAVSALSLDVQDGEFMVLVGPGIGDRVGVTVRTAEAHLFDRTTGLRLG